MSEESEREEVTQDNADYSKDPYFYKYCSDDEQVIKGVFEDHRIRFTQPAALNDPLEFRPAIRVGPKADRLVITNRFKPFVYNGVEFQSEVSWLQSCLEKERLRRYGVLSLTKVDDCFDMWSRYANGHKGFLLVLKSDFNKHLCMSPKEINEVRPVTYPKRYDISVKRLLNRGGGVSADFCHRLLFFRKSRRWKHEHEYRMVRPLTECVERRPRHKPHWRCICLFDFPLECIASVRFGACMTAANKKRIMAACKGFDIEFLQSRITTDWSDRWGRPGSVNVGPIQDIPNLLEIDDPWITQMGGSLEMVPGPISVATLNELPYYSGNENWVEQYYKAKKASASP